MTFYLRLAYFLFPSSHNLVKTFQTPGSAAIPILLFPRGPVLGPLVSFKLPFFLDLTRFLLLKITGGFSPCRRMYPAQAVFFIKTPFFPPWTFFSFFRRYREACPPDISPCTPPLRFPFHKAAP